MGGAYVIAVYLRLWTQPALRRRACQKTGAGFCFWAQTGCGSSETRTVRDLAHFPAQGLSVFIISGGKLLLVLSNLQLLGKWRMKFRAGLWIQFPAAPVYLLMCFQCLI